MIRSGSLFGLFFFLISYMQSTFIFHSEFECAKGKFQYDETYKVNISDS